MSPETAPAAPPGWIRRVDRFSGLGDVVKFAAVAAVLAMLGDAVIGHALLWENDPYWTYWVTDTLLITSVFAVGTALLGAGVARGAVITTVQMLVLTTYYWSLSPIGLPGSPEWLDLQHTWVTGPPVHFGVYYLGYLVALWLWRRRRTGQPIGPHRQLGAEAGGAVVVALTLVTTVGLVQTAAVGQFPGVSWFVMRTVVLVPFTLAWWAFAGRDRGAAVGGGAVAAVLLVAYGHYLGPVGLPSTDLRILAQDLPPADVHWLSYSDEFLVMGPLTVLISLAAFLAASAWHAGRWAPLGLTRTVAAASVVAVTVAAAAGLVTAQAVERGDRTATVTSAGDPRVEIGAAFEGDLATAQGDLRFRATQNSTRRTPLTPHDAVALEATIVHPDGTRYEVAATIAMVNEPTGRFTTWGGIGFDKWHHGRSGIGTAEIDPTRSEVAIYGIADVRADGEVVASGVPVHAMTVDGAGVELHVGDAASPVPGLPDGHLRVVWDGRSGDSPEGPERARHLLGGTVLLLLIGAALVALRSASGARRS